MKKNINILLLIIVIIIIYINNQSKHTFHMIEGRIKKSFRYSKQRESLLTLLQTAKNHPTAEWLYERLKKIHPRLSLGTVYRNLSLLAEQGVVIKIHSNSACDRFEARLEPHYHLICEKCGSVSDLDCRIDESIIQLAGKQCGDFIIHNYRLEFFGLCGRCRQKA